MSKQIIYICAVLQLQGIRKKPFESGEEVTAENFPSDHFEKLINEGFIKEKPTEDVAEVVDANDTSLADAEAKALADVEAKALADVEAADKAAEEAKALDNPGEKTKKK